MSIRKEELVSFYSHLLGAVLALVGFFVLVLPISGRSDLVIVSAVYTVSVFFLFSASSLYHYFKREEDGKGFWRRLDHVAIFFMIAGSYTPILYIYLEGDVKWIALGIQWGLVLLGFLFKMLFIRSPRFLSTAIYLGMGWMAVFIMKPLYAVMPFDVFMYLIYGAVAYTVGAIIYGLKKPTLILGRFGFHEIFHIFILLGGFFHFIMIFKAIGLLLV